MPSTVKIAPSLLSADFSQLGLEIERLEAAGADMIHIDVMDGHFVPNLTMGPPVIKAIRKCTKLPFDVHLMISPVDVHLEAYVEAGADMITVHAEATHHLHRSLQNIRRMGKKVGVSLNPATSLASIEYILEEVDLVLIMSVNPGFGGQKFIESQLDKIDAVREMRETFGLTFAIEVDGGIDISTAQRVQAVGADILVAGTAIFKDGPVHYARNITTLRRGPVAAC